MNTVSRLSRRFRASLATCLTLAGLILPAAALPIPYHPPFAGWIGDQKITSPGTYFATRYFRVFEYDGAPLSRMKSSSDETIYSAQNVTFAACTQAAGDFDAGCASDGTGYKVSFPTLPTKDGVTTITLRAKQNVTAGLTGWTSFTLQRDTSSIANPPILQGLPSEAIQLPSSTTSAVYKTTFVVGDLDRYGTEDIKDSPIVFTAKSSNQALLLDSTTDSNAITFTLMPNACPAGRRRLPLWPS